MKLLNPIKLMNRIRMARRALCVRSYLVLTMMSVHKRLVSKVITLVMDARHRPFIVIKMLNSKNMLILKYATPLLHAKFTHLETVSIHKCKRIYKYMLKGRSMWTLIQRPKYRSHKWYLSMKIHHRLGAVKEKTRQGLKVCWISLTMIIKT